MLQHRKNPKFCETYCDWHLFVLVILFSYCYRRNYRPILTTFTLSQLGHMLFHCKSSFQHPIHIFKDRKKMANFSLSFFRETSYIWNPPPASNRVKVSWLESVFVVEYLWLSPCCAANPPFIWFAPLINSAPYLRTCLEIGTRPQEEAQMKLRSEATRLQN